MHIIIFILIAALWLEQLGQNFLYKKMDFLINIIGNFQGAIFYLGGFSAITFVIFNIYKNIKSKKFKLQKWDICFVLLLFWGLISVVLAENKELAIFGGHRLDGYISYLIYAACYIVTRTLKSDKVRLWIIRFFTFVATSLCMDFLFKDSITSIFHNQNHFGYLLTLSCMLLSGLFIYERKKHLKILYIILFVINTYTLINVNTLGCYLAVLLGLSFSLLLMFITKNEKAFALKALLMLVFFIGISIGDDYHTNTTQNNFTEFSTDIEKIATNAPDVESAGSSRIKLWNQAFKYIKERPFFGYGPEGTSDLYLFPGNEVSYDRPHNEYIQTALFMGIPAAIFYLTGLFMLFIYCIKNRKQLPSYAIISGTAVFAYCISAFFGNSMYYTTPYFFMMLGMLSPTLQQE